MSLQRRLLIYLLVCAPLVWAVALVASVYGGRHDVNELFDTELIRLARQVQVLLHASQPTATTDGPAQPQQQQQRGSTGMGEADLNDMAIAVWDAQGRLILHDREGMELPYQPEASGFVDTRLKDEPWRLYYLQSASGQWLVASGQKAYERDHIVFALTATQFLPWLLVLPVLLAALAWAVRRALLPVNLIAGELQQRGADELRPVRDEGAPTEIRPLLQAMNSLFFRIEQTLTRERRFTADAAHELRTPLAVLRAQWDVVRRSTRPEERAQAETRFSAGLDRMDRLVTQMLALSRVENRLVPGAAQTFAEAVDWHGVVEQAITDCLPLADRRRIEIACDWPADASPALAMKGDSPLLTVLLRNLLDNAVRYAPESSLVSLRFFADRLEIENDGPSLQAEQLARLGERFYRPDGQQESGSGLGVSIVTRIAQLHGLKLSFLPRDAHLGGGMRVVLGFGLPVADPNPA